MVATLGETTGYYALRQMHERMRNDPVGQRILAWVSAVLLCRTGTFHVFSCSRFDGSPPPSRASPTPSLHSDKPRVSEDILDFEKFASYPAGSFGRAYYEFMRGNVRGC